MLDEDPQRDDSRHRSQIRLTGDLKVQLPTGEVKFTEYRVEATHDPAHVLRSLEVTIGGSLSEIRSLARVGPAYASLIATQADRAAATQVGFVARAKPALIREANAVPGGMPEDPGRFFEHPFWSQLILRLNEFEPHRIGAPAL